MGADDDFTRSNHKFEIAEKFGFEQFAVIAVQSAFRVAGKLEAVHFARPDVIVDGAAKDEHGISNHRSRVE